MTRMKTLIRFSPRALPALGIALCLSATTVHAQLVRDELTPDGIPINQDYFSADDRYPETRNLLLIVEKYHMGEKVIRNLRPGRYDAALVDIRYTLHKFPNHPKALLLAAEVAKHLDRISMPIKYFEHAIELYPQYGITHYQYGQYLLAIGLVEEAIERLQVAVRVDADLAEAWAELARAHLASGDDARARESAAEARRLGYLGAIAGLDSTAQSREP
jgi:predicted Zn-dependent protease